LENECQDIVEGSAPSETKEKTADTVRPEDVEEPATLSSLPAQTERIFIVCILWCAVMWKERWWQ
jgi:hypothetical protein